MRCTVLIILLSAAPAVLGIDICPTREITSSSGEITTPNYPNKYPANTDCTLTIKQPLDTKFLFNFTYIDLGGQVNSYVCRDSITISGRRPREFCGAKMNYSYEFNLNVVTLRFKSNNNTNRTGFKLVFTTVINKTPRGRQLPVPISICPSRTIQADEVGRIMSPGYPAGNYGKKLSCILVIKMPFQKNLDLAIEHMEIAAGGFCGKEQLSFVEPGYVHATCGQSLYPKRTRRSDFDKGLVSVRYFSDGTTHSKGFILSYRLRDKYRLHCSRANGKLYLKRAINMTDFLKRPNGDISLKFRTKHSNGLLLYIKGGPNMYLLLKLQKGRIVFEFNYGIGNITLTSKLGKLNNRRWQEVLVERRGEDVSLDVDSYPPKKYRTLCRDMPWCENHFADYDCATKLDDACPIKCGRCSVPYRPNTVSAQIPYNVTQLLSKPQSSVDSAMYVFGRPSDIPFPKGWVQHFVINDLQPIASYLAKDTTFTLHGRRKMRTSECYNDH